MTFQNHSKLPFILFGILVIVSTFFMVRAAYQEPATMDELAHIPSGYGYTKLLDYRLNPEHPPLIKALAAVPLLFQDIKFPTDDKSWKDDLNGQWDAGKKFLYGSGNNADNIVFASRIFPIILTLILIILIYIWANELLGRWWALLPTLLFGFSPTIIAHGHYVTTDVGAALGTFFATYAFVRFLLSPKKGNVIFAGIALGIAELMKFSNVLLLPYFVIIGIIFLIFERIRIKNLGNEEKEIYKKTKSIKRYILQFFIILIIAFLIIFAVYALFTLNYPQERQITDSQKILESFSPQWIAKISLFFTESTLLRPIGEYFLGFLMVFQRATGGNTGYFLGEVSNLGWWYYFPVVFLLKETIPTLLIIFFGTIFSCVHVFKGIKKEKSSIKRFSDYLGTNFAEFSMLLFIIIYWAYSMKSPLNIGMRHLIPTLPFIYILAASGLKTAFNTLFSGNQQGAQSTPSKNFSVAAYTYGRTDTKKIAIRRIGLGILIVWFIGETLIASPYFLSYFNQIGGGTFGGFRYVADSNYDWGQDLKRLKNWVEEKNNDTNPNNDIKKIAVDYFGGGNPKYYLGSDRVVEWNSVKGNPRAENIEWLAVSGNVLVQASGKKMGTFEQKDDERYLWLHELKPTNTEYSPIPTPDIRIGTSIFIYHL